MICCKFLYNENDYFFSPDLFFWGSHYYTREFTSGKRKNLCAAVLRGMRWKSEVSTRKFENLHNLMQLLLYHSVWHFPLFYIQNRNYVAHIAHAVVSLLALEKDVIYAVRCIILVWLNLDIKCSSITKIAA